MGGILFWAAALVSVGDSGNAAARERI